MLWIIVNHAESQVNRVELMYSQNRPEGMVGWHKEQAFFCSHTVKHLQLGDADK